MGGDRGAGSKESGKSTGGGRRESGGKQDSQGGRNSEKYRKFILQHCISTEVGTITEGAGTRCTGSGKFSGKFRSCCPPPPQTNRTIFADAILILSR